MDARSVQGLKVFSILLGAIAEQEIEVASRVNNPLDRDPRAGRLVEDAMGPENRDPKRCGSGVEPTLARQVSQLFEVPTESFEVPALLLCAELTSSVSADLGEILQR
ncbi:MAG TPA: hypothetical protein PK413_00640 [Thermoanaerobaculia bacterium]|nr:hypothetical protein [Thermoanaerobaculia bacterium]